VYSLIQPALRQALGRLGLDLLRPRCSLDPTPDPVSDEESFSPGSRHA